MILFFAKVHKINAGNFKKGKCFLLKYGEAYDGFSCSQVAGLAADPETLAVNPETLFHDDHLAPDILIVAGQREIVQAYREAI